MTNLITVKLDLTVGELNALQAVIKASSLGEYEKDLIRARLLEERRRWQITESKRLLANMVAELTPSAPDVDNMMSVSGIQDELNLLAKELEKNPPDHFHSVGG